MLRVKTYLISVHIAGWLLFMAFPLLFMNGGDQTNHSFLILSSPYYWLLCFTYISLFYINGYFLFPRFFFQKKYIKYFLSAALLCAGVYFLQPYDHLLHNSEPANPFFMRQGPPPPPNDNRYRQGPPQFPGDGTPDEANPSYPPPGAPRLFQSGPPHYPGPGPGPFGRRFDSTSLFIFVMIMALSAAVKTIQQWQAIEQRAQQAETDKANAELSFLKAQVNPHFLFNTLNNIYTLAITKDKNAPDSIMKLSNIMRYVTDEATEDFVPLENELDCINNYIELQRLRLGKKTTVDFHVTGNIQQKTIAPLILMTFIENVFKYGVSKHESSNIIIGVLAAGSNITFFCENAIFTENRRNDRSGIGLENTRKRLEHLYPGRYSLSISTKNNLFAVNLNLQT